MLKGVDVSGHEPNWEPADDDAFVFIKATEGSTYFSTSSLRQVEAARAKGLQVGHYHFMVPGNAARQAGWFVGNLVEKDLIKPGDLLACDWETHKEGHPSAQDRAEFRAEVKRLLPNHKEGLYCDTSDWLNTSVKAGDFLWIAHYTTMAEPGIAATWHFWQYTDKPIDQDYGHFDSLDSLKRWAGGGNYSIKYQSPYVELGSGRYVTPIDKQILIACAMGSGWGTVRLSQGGLSTSVADSALTHAGLGAGDIAIDGRSKDAVWEYCAWLNRSGIVAFPRGFGFDSFPPHIHFASLESYAHAHPQLQAQIVEFKRGGDGLVGDKPYSGPKAPLGRWSESPANPINVNADTGRYEVIATTLNGRDLDNNVVRKRERGFVLQAAKRIYRWGRWNVATSTPTLYAPDYLKKVA